MLSLIKLSRSLPDSVVLLRRGFQIEAGSASLSIYPRIGSRNFAQQLRRLAEVRRHPPSTRLRRTRRRRLQQHAPLQARRKVLLYRLPRNQQSQIDDENPRECAASPFRKEERPEMRGFWRRR